MRLKARSRGQHENKIFELCVKNQFIWENKQNNSLFPLKSSFFLMFAGRMWPAGRVFETPGLLSVHFIKRTNLRDILSLNWCYINFHKCLRARSRCLAGCMLHRPVADPVIFFLCLPIFAASLSVSIHIEKITDRKMT